MKEGVVGRVRSSVQLGSGWELRTLFSLLGDCGGGTSERGLEDGVVDGIPGSIIGF